MSDLLEKIAARTRARLADERIDVEEIRKAAHRVAASRPPFAFSNALRREGINIIAEIKSASPSAGSIVANPDVDEIAASYARGGAAAISVVTEPEFFHGSDHWISSARRASGLPVIMKEFIVSSPQLLRGIAAGADAVLLLAALLGSEVIREFIALLDSHGCDALIEVHDEDELGRAILAGARLVGVNNRNLRTFEVDLGTSERLASRIPRDLLKVSESGIVSRLDIDRLRAAGFNAFLVGESLLRQNDRAAAVQALIGGIGT